jgi:hypothetical protein
VTRSRSTTTVQTGSLPTLESDRDLVHLYNGEPTRRTVAVVLRRPGDPSSVERRRIPPGGAVRLELPVVDTPLTVGCHSDDGRSGVCTYRPDRSGTVVFSFEDGSILLDVD